MPSKYRGIMIGTGGMGRVWLEKFWPPFQDRAEIVALVDVDRSARELAREITGLPSQACFPGLREAVEEVDVDFCCIVTPPAYHREAVEAACRRGWHILSEKPIATTWEDCVAVARAVEEAGVKMMVTQNYRYTPRILTLKKAVQELGAVNYIMSRYAADYRVRNSWGAFRHAMAHPLLVDGGIHHLDQIRNLSGGNCVAIAGFEWNPGHLRGDPASYCGSDSFDGEPCALLTMRMDNGSHAVYEGNNIAAGRENGWHQEFYRVEAEGGTAWLDADHRVIVEEKRNGRLEVRELPLVQPPWEGHLQMPAHFLDWLDGGPEPPTSLRDNLQSTAMLFAALKACSAGVTIQVQYYLQELYAHHRVNN